MQESKGKQGFAVEVSWGCDKGAGSLYSGHVGEGAHMLLIESQAQISCTTHATLGCLKLTNKKVILVSK